MKLVTNHSIVIPAKAGTQSTAMDGGSADYAGSSYLPNTNPAKPDTVRGVVSNNPETKNFAENKLNPLEQTLDAIDVAINDEDWEAIASPLIQPILNQAKADPDFIAKQWH